MIWEHVDHNRFYAVVWIVWGYDAGDAKDSAIKVFPARRMSYITKDVLYNEGCPI